MSGRVSYEGMREQAEKLRETEKALKESEEKYRTLVEQAGDAIVILQAGRTVYRNQAWEKLIGFNVEETSEKMFLDFIDEEDRDLVKLYYENRLKGLPAPEQYEIRIKAHHGKLVTMEVRPRIITLKGKPATMVIMRDLSERRRAEEALRESEARFRSIFESARDCIFIKDHALKYQLVNPCMESLFEIKASDMIGRTDEDIFGEEVACHIREVDKRVLNGQAIEEEHTKPVRGKNTTFHVIKVPIRNNRDEIVGLCGIARDITDRKLAEAALCSYHEKLRSLASQLSLAEERERRRISSYVHDNIGQNLAFAKIKLTELKKQIPKSEAIDGVEEVCRLVSQTIQDTRGLVSELGSPVLYEIGFGPAMKALVVEFKNRHDLLLSFKDDGLEKPLSEDIQILLYQAVRELLANMVKHSRAKSGVVSVKKEGDRVRIEVKDDGVGFDTNSLGDPSVSSRGYGLFSIRERLEPLGGGVGVVSEKGLGTSIVVTAPIGSFSKDV